ncbi:MAG: MCE family protein [Rhodococcus sp. (in: high G+C Gram-positive bacteria)]
MIRSGAPSRLRQLGPTTSTLAARGIAAALAVVMTAVGIVAYSSGAFDRTPVVYADIDASAGLLVGEIGVQYRGVQIGKVIDIDSGTTRSRVTMALDPSGVPSSAVVRVVPRTLFGDVYIRLVTDSDAPGPTVQPGDHLAMDTSAEAVQLGEVYRRVTHLLDRLEPAEAHTALTAVATALRGRGDALGDTIDRLSRTTGSLEPHLMSVLDHTPQMIALTEAFASAAPDVLATVDAATALSQTALDHSTGVEALLTTAAALASSANVVASQNTEKLVTVVRRGTPVLSTVADNSSGLASTLDQFAPFGAAGARIFATGRFDITAVPDFSEPLPYTAADCPRYPGLDGGNCGLAVVQEEAVGASLPLNAASTMLLAPVLRGTEVTIR